MTADQVAAVKEAVRAIRRTAPNAFIATCCGRVFVGAFQPKKCRTCEKIPQAVEVTSAAEVDSAIL
jgi:hypothetical protein